jgi:hypothetical protein
LALRCDSFRPALRAPHQYQRWERPNHAKANMKLGKRNTIPEPGRKETVIPFRKDDEKETVPPSLTRLAWQR